MYLCISTNKHAPKIYRVDSRNTEINDLDDNLNAPMAFVYISAYKFFSSLGSFLHSRGQRTRAQP